ncbi:MAG TPA: type II and III secretion system protein [Candidatus Acidoferrales bacterium]|nr:type II and III secretion system protein [Candidatus Acidoferrales bacterium]
MRIRVWLTALALAATLAAQAPNAADLFLQGRKAERAGHLMEAYLLYSQAAAMSPETRTYWLRSQAVRTRALMEAKAGAFPGSSSEAGNVVLPDDEIPAPDIPAATAADRADVRSLLPPPELKPKAGTQDFDLRGDAKQLFEKVAQAFALQCVFDDDYQAPAQIRFQMQGVDYRDALHGLEAATASFIVPLGPRIFLVVKDTPQKRTEREPTAAIELRLPEAASQQDFNAVITAVQQAFAIEKVAFDTQNNSVIMRDRVSKVIPARMMFEDLMAPRAQVMIDMQFLEVSRNDAITYGIDLQNTFSLVALTTRFQNMITLPQNIAGLVTFGGGYTLMGIGVMNTSLVSQMNHSSGTILLNAQLRSVDGQAATFHVGDRYPITTTGYFGPSNFTTGTGVNSGLAAYAPPPAVTFEDLGFNLKVTPTVHSTKSVGLDIEAEFKVLSGASVNGIPVISNRTIKSKTDLHLDEWALIAGLMNRDQAHSIAGVAGLSRIPFLAPLTSTQTKSKDSRQVLVMMRPHLLTLPPGQRVAHTFYIGSDNRPLTPL